jgi:hypothetical protein
MADEKQPTTTLGMAHDLARTLMGSLPPTFLLLVIINCVFLGLVMWFLNSQLRQRADMVNLLVTRCLEIALQAAPPEHPPVH